MKEIPEKLDLEKVETSLNFCVNLVRQDPPLCGEDFRNHLVTLCSFVQRVKKSVEAIEILVALHQKELNQKNG